MNPEWNGENDFLARLTPRYLTMSDVRKHDEVKIKEEMFLPEALDDEPY